MRFGWWILAAVAVAGGLRWFWQGPLWTDQEAAEFLEVDLLTLRDWAQDRPFFPSRHGGVWRGGELARWQQRQASVSP